MNPVRKIEMQCTHAEFLRELPFACGNNPYEVIGERVIVHEKDRDIEIRTREEPVRHLGSLNLPMEEVTFKFNDFTEEEANRFMEDFRIHVLRLGG